MSVANFNKLAQIAKSALFVTMWIIYEKLVVNLVPCCRYTCMMTCSCSDKLAPLALCDLPPPKNSYFGLLS